MWKYDAPTLDMRFAIERVLGAPARWRECPVLADTDMDTVAAVLDEAARFGSDVLLPVNRSGDLQGCTWHADGRVTTPDGYRRVYRSFVDGGWPALPCEPHWGGQGLPLLVDAATREMLTACGHAWTMYPDLLHGAYETIKAHAREEDRQRYLPEIVSGRTLAAMALTEADAGSDLGRLRTRAVLQDDGSVRVTGQKIFISGGEHDLTDNIVHLVLCRLPDAPPGSKGISLALVPKILPGGQRNAVHCDGIESKMGIHGSATCQMRYEDATGWLVGEPNRGLAAMFLMMNSARLHVGLQGLGHQEIALQNARRHAQEREQFGGPVARQPAMRRLLLRLAATTQAHRLIAYRSAMALDLAAHHMDPAVRSQAQQEAALLTPLVKAVCTHHGFHGASDALQVWGGYGYVHESGIEQTVRDARIAMIYEGSNEIQAIDLLQRKILGDGGAAFTQLLSGLRKDAQACAAVPELADHAAALSAQMALAAEGVARLLTDAAERGPTPLLVHAADVMDGMHTLLLAWAFAAQARAAVAQRQLAATGGPWSDAWLQERLEIARFGVDYLLDGGEVAWRRVTGRQRELPMLRPRA